MSLMTTSQLARIRARSQRRETETITAFTRTVTTDNTTGDVTNEDSDPIYEGGAQYKPASLQGNESESVGQRILEDKPIIKLPVGSPILPIDTIISISASLADPGLVGVELKVTGRPSRGQVTMYRYPVEEVIGA